MSIHAVSRVLADKVTRGNDRLVLIALADYANDDGTGVFPSIPKIAAKANCDERTVIRCLKHLQELEEIEEVGRTPKGTRAWRIWTGLTRDKKSCVVNVTPDKHDAGPLTSTTSTPDKSNTPLMEEPSIEPSENQQPAPSARSGGKSKAKDRGKRFVPNAQEPADAVIVELYELWIANTPQPEGAVLTNGRASQCRARMREQAEGVDREEALTVARARMVEGLEGWFGSDYHRDRQAFDWETFFRSRKKVEMFRQRHLAQLGASNGKRANHAEYDTTKRNPELAPA
jgi:hypothetical protein